MSTFTVYGADGRRISRGVAESYALEIAHRIQTETGETITVTPDTNDDDVAAGDVAAVEVSGVAQDKRPRRKANPSP